MFTIDINEIKKATDPQSISDQRFLELNETKINNENATLLLICNKNGNSHIAVEYDNGDTEIYYYIGNIFKLVDAAIHSRKNKTFKIKVETDGFPINIKIVKEDQNSIYGHSYYKKCGL